MMVSDAGLDLPPVSLLRNASLFLDFDGTLVEIAQDPTMVRVTAELRELLQLLQVRLNGRVAVLSGRAASDVETMLDPVRMTIGGSHGLETRIDGSPAESIERPVELEAVADQLRMVQRRYPGVLIEEKPLGVALHYRQAPEAEQACREVFKEAAEASGLEIQPGKMVFELKAPGGSKGASLRKIMDTAAFAGTRPIFLGDDLTDEPGFEAAAALGGAGVLIGDQRKTSAMFRLASVGDALDWLRSAAGAAE